MNRQSYVYILFNKRNGTLYTGVTSNLTKRIWQHKQKNPGSFTSKYGANRLGYYEVFSDIRDAIAREKQIKGGSRVKKLDLIEKQNPDWRDLWEDIVENQ